MFRPTGRNSSPFSLVDMDMWDTKSHFTAQSSAWCGMAAVSGSGYLSQVNTSTSGKTSGFRQNDPGLRRWQSLSHLPSRVSPRSFSPSPGAGLRAARAESSFRQAEMVQWLQDAQDRLEPQMDLLRPTDIQLRHSKNMAKILDMKQGQLVETRTAIEQEKASELSPFEKSTDGGELHQKVLLLEKELLQMRSALDKGSNVGRSSGSLTRTAQIEQGDFTEQQRADAELCKVREALKEAEAQAKTREEERNQALQKLQTSTETQRTLVDQTAEMSQRLSNATQNQCELQEQLTVANNKISQGCLEKAMLSTQVLKLEDEIRELNSQLSEAQSHKNHMTQVKADLQQKAQVERTDQSSEIKDQLICEVEKIKQSLKKSQSELQQQTAETVKKSDQITALEAERTQLIREKEELLSKIPADGHKELTDIQDKYNQLRKSSDALELENHKLKDHCLLLESEVLEKDEKLQLQEEKYQQKDAGRVRSIEELQAVALHWTDKWQRVAMTLQSTQAELEELKKRNSKHEIQRGDVHVADEIEKLKKEAQKDKEEIEKLLQYKANMETMLTKNKESDSLLRLELDACKQELELEKSRSHTNKGVECVLTQDKETVTDFSTLPPTAESSLFWETPLDSHSSHNKSPQVTGNSQDNDDQTDSQSTESLKAQLEESKRITNQLQQEKILAIHRLQTLKQLYSVKDERPSMEGRIDKPVAPYNSDTDQQRRMVTEQLKNLFKEQEVNGMEKTDDGSRSSLETDWSQTTKGVKSALDRRSWHHGSGLMPVFEEDEEEEEEEDQAEDAEGACAEKDHTEENLHRQDHQAFNTSTSSMSVEINKLMPKKDNLLPDSDLLNIQQPTQDPPTAVEDTFSDDINASFSNCDLQKGPPLFCPDGIFLAELVDIYSPDEDEEPNK